jgi:hypothetical protein
MKFLNSDLRVFRAGAEHHLADEKSATRSVVAGRSEPVFPRHGNNARPLVWLGSWGVPVSRAL